MITRSLLILYILFIISFQIQGQSTSEKAVTIRAITENPWPFDLEIEPMEITYGKFLKKEKYTVKNRFESSKRDTIVRFYKGKNEIFFFKPYNGKAYFIAANISDSRIKIKGDLAPGLSSDEFYRRIAYPRVNSDTVHISLPDGAYKTSVILKDEKIHQIKIDARNKNR
jgi:hypothetical protein